MTNLDKEHISVRLKNNHIEATYRADKRSHPLRIARTSNWDRAILRMVHANMRLNGMTSLTSLDLLVAEFRDLLDKNDPQRLQKFALFMEKLKLKEWDKLGVNV